MKRVCQFDPWICGKVAASQGQAQGLIDLSRQRAVFGQRIIQICLGGDDLCLPLMNGLQDKFALGITLGIGKFKEPVIDDIVDHTHRGIGCQKETLPFRRKAHCGTIQIGILCSCQFVAGIEWWSKYSVFRRERMAHACLDVPLVCFQTVIQHCQRCATSELGIVRGVGIRCAIA